MAERPETGEKRCVSKGARYGGIDVTTVDPSLAGVPQIGMSRPPKQQNLCNRPRREMLKFQDDTRRLETTWSLMIWAFFA